MSFMLQIWMKLMVLMLLMMSNLTIMTMMMILMMIRPGEGGTFCWLASQPAGRPWNTYLVRKKSSIPKTQNLRKKNSKWVTIVHFLGSSRELTPSSILIFNAAFNCGLQKLIYIDLMQVFQKTVKTREICTSEAGFWKIHKYMVWTCQNVYFFMEISNLRSKWTQI